MSAAYLIEELIDLKMHIAFKVFRGGQASRAEEVQLINLSQQLEDLLNEN